MKKPEPPATKSALEGKGAQDDCRIVSAYLVEYIMHGEDAPDLMPEVARHLRTCVDCQEELATLQSQVGAFEEWRTFLAGLREERHPKLIARLGHWLLGAGDRTALVSDHQLQAGFQVGDWKVRGTAYQTLGLSPIQMTASLGEAMGELTIVLRPESTAVDDQPVWQADFQLGEGSAVRNLDVGLGTETACLTGFREVRVGEPRTMEMIVSTEPCFAHIRWRVGRRERQQRLELPVSLGDDS